MKKRFEKLQGKIIDREFIAFDIETYVNGPNRGKFLFGGCFDGIDYIHFTDREKMKRFITNSAFLGKIFVAHNAEYDLNRIFLKDKTLWRYFVGSRFLFAKFPRSNGKGKSRLIQYWDSFNYTFRSLADVGLLLGYEKKTIEFQDKITGKYIEYNRRDCEIVWKFMEGFQDTLNALGGNLKPTLAGCGMDVYRREHMPPEAEFWAIPGSIKKDFRDAFFGGRTEIFNMNKFKKVYYYDINSSYAYSMTEDFPVLDSWVNKPDLDFPGCSFAAIETPNMYYPVLPFRSNKVIFPTGKWRGWYYNNELNYAISQGVKVRPIRGVHYKESFPVFKDFISVMQKQKKKSNDKFEYSIFKTLMNSLYGRFAMRGDGLELYKGDERELVPMDGTAVNVIWSGMIAAGGRINLHKLITRSNAVYCDTDSSMTRTVQKTNKRPGGISLKKEFLEFRANAPKDYEFKEAGKPRRKLKGIPARALEIEKNHFQYEIPIKFKSSQRRKIPIHKWITVDKFISTEYDKRIILQGGDTEPIHIIQE